MCAAFPAIALPLACTGSPHTLRYEKSQQKAYRLTDGSIATIFRMHVNADGMKHAYHRDGIVGGGVDSLCNGGKPYPAGRRPYNASENKAACAQFAADYKAIKNSGWKNPQVGAINWFGVLGTGTANIDGINVANVEPVEQADSSGFFVSPTALEDHAGFERNDQRRYIDAEVVPAAVIKQSDAMKNINIRMGSFGVAIHKNYRIAVPFVVGDYGPRIGEGTFALGRLLKGLSLETATRKNIYSAHIEKNDVLWIFFGGEVASPPYTPDRIKYSANQNFEAWGGMSRLNECLGNPAIPEA